MARDELAERSRALTHAMATTAVQRIRAWNTVRAHATDLDDEQMLLEMLGFVDSPPPGQVRGLAPCGTVGAHARHRRNGEEPCQACREAYNAYHRERYGPENPRRPDPCGTTGAYQRHFAHGEKPCAACAAAHRDYQARYHRPNRKRAA